MTSFGFRDAREGFEVFGDILVLSVKRRRPKLASATLKRIFKEN